MVHEFQLRNARPQDHPRIMAVMPTWWGGRDLRYGVPRLFLDHFYNTSFVMERGLEMAGFLIGFLSPARPDQGYAHFLGVDPKHHRQGIGRRLYERFFLLCREHGRSLVHSRTAPVNRASIAFHQKLGFEILQGDGEIGGIPVIKDYNLPGEPMVGFVKRLS